MRHFIYGWLAASVLWAGLSWAQGFWSYDNQGNQLNVHPLTPDPNGPSGWYDNHGRSGMIMPQPGYRQNPC